VYSTEQKVLKDVVDILCHEGMTPHEVAEEVSLLTAWAAFSHQQHSGVHWNEQQPNLQYALNRMSENLGEVGRVFETSRLSSKLSDASISAVMDLLNSLAGSSQRVLALALNAVVEELGTPSQMLTAETGQLLAALCDRGEQNVSLYYGASVPVLLALDSAKKALVTLSVVSAYPVSVGYLLEANLRFNDSAESETPSDLADFVIAVPPLQAKAKNSKLKLDELATLKVARECSVRGVVTVAPSVLNSRAAMDVRVELINNNWLDAVIGLPKGTFLNTGVPPVVLVIDKTRQKGAPIVFIEAGVPQTDNDRKRLVTSVRDKKPSKQGATASQSDIQKNDYDLTISRYKLGLATLKLEQLENTVSLDGVAEIVRAQNLKATDESELTTVFLEASVRDITESGRMGTPLKLTHVDKTQLRRAQNQRIYPGDILLAIKGSVGRLAFVDGSCGENWIAGQAFMIIRPKGAAVSTPYLYRYLASELIQEYIEETATGTVMALLKAADVSNILVPLPSSDLKVSVESTHAEILVEYAAIEEHRDTICRLEQQNWTLSHNNETTHE
jgi:hypothetical protein